MISSDNPEVQLLIRRERWGRRRRRLYVFALMALFLTGVGWSAEEINLRLRSQGLLPGDLLEGTSVYTVQSRGRCAGFLEFTLARTDSDNLEFEGSGSVLILLKDGEPPTDLNLAIQGAFNSLDQLGGSLIRLDWGENRLSVGTTEVNPITIRYRVKTGPIQRVHETTIPGPITIGKVENRSYEVRYAHLSNLDQLRIEPLASPILEELQLRVEQLDEAPASCLPKHRRAVDLTEFAESVRMLIAMAEGVSQAFFR